MIWLYSSYFVIVHSNMFQKRHYLKSWFLFLTTWLYYGLKTALKLHWWRKIGIGKGKELDRMRSGDVILKSVFLSPQWGGKRVALLCKIDSTFLSYQVLKRCILTRLVSNTSLFSRSTPLHLLHVLLLEKGVLFGLHSCIILNKLVLLFV